MDFNPAAQEPYENLKETQKFLDKYIAEKIKQEIISLGEGMKVYEEKDEVKLQKIPDIFIARNAGYNQAIEDYKAKILEK